MSLEREAAVDRLETLIETVDSGPMPVPVREVWVYGDLALGMDPIDRLDVYLTKDILLENDEARDQAYYDKHGVRGVGTAVDADWADEFPDAVRANDHGHVAPERCLAAHLLDDDEPIHLEVCNTSFEDNVTQRLRGARLREDYTQLLDPRGVCLWVDGTWSSEAFEKLRESAFAMPTLSASLEMLGMDESAANEAAAAVHAWREDQDGVTVRGDVV
ncbi:hypothetical protein Halru_2380 [Halovivax ruber XH-70]|uniref:Uncharacterized protein n=1 Tax=Halovivax ruber (strain DSM 18193 / JCM 13892 / XH-70) TaxID=797302 RepID=L0IBM3_HALRX|nr:hypothetical protein [Halovivax ruber]AGB16965.1 hypothetical protein Halru_2380 [Halovivax ruber XH-70]